VQAPLPSSLARHDPQRHGRSRRDGISRAASHERRPHPDRQGLSVLRRLVSAAIVGDAQAERTAAHAALGYRRIHGAHVVAPVDGDTADGPLARAPARANGDRPRRSYAARRGPRAGRRDHRCRLAPPAAAGPPGRAAPAAPPLGAEEVRAIGRELTRRFRDRSVEEIVAMESAPTDPLDALHTRARGITEQIVAMLRGRTLYVSGAINILDHPEFFDIDQTRALLRTFH